MFSNPDNPRGYLAGALRPELRAITGSPEPRVCGGLVQAPITPEEFMGTLCDMPKYGRLMITLDFDRAVSVAALVFRDPLAWAAVELTVSRVMSWAEAHLPLTPRPEEMLQPKTQLHRWRWLPLYELITRDGLPHLHPHILAPITFEREGKKLTVNTKGLWLAAPLIGAILREELRRICSAHGFDLDSPSVRAWANWFSPEQQGGKKLKLIMPINASRAEWFKHVEQARLNPFPAFKPCATLPPPLTDAEIGELAKANGWCPYPPAEEERLRALAAHIKVIRPYWRLPLVKIKTTKDTKEENRPDERLWLSGVPVEVLVTLPKHGPRRRLVDELFGHVAPGRFAKTLVNQGDRTFISSPALVNRSELEPANHAIRAALKRGGWLTHPKAVETVGPAVPADMFSGGFVVPRVNMGSGWFLGQPRKIASLVNGQVPVKKSGHVRLKPPDKFDFYRIVPMELSVGDLVHFEIKVRAKRNGKTKRVDAFTPMRVGSVAAGSIITTDGWKIPFAFARYAYAVDRAIGCGKTTPRLAIDGTDIQRLVGKSFRWNPFGHELPWLLLESFRRRLSEEQNKLIQEQWNLLKKGAPWSQLLALTLKIGRGLSPDLVVAVAGFQSALAIGFDVSPRLSRELLERLSDKSPGVIADELVRLTDIPGTRLIRPPQERSPFFDMPEPTPARRFT